MGFLSPMLLGGRGKDGFFEPNVTRGYKSKGGRGHVEMVGAFQGQWKNDCKSVVFVSRQELPIGYVCKSSRVFFCFFVPSH